MLIGILSDTHGRLDAAAAGVAALRERGATYLIHCGDVGSTDILDQLAGLPGCFVTGNTDFDRDDLLRYGLLIGVIGYHPMADLNLDGKRLAVLHGDDHALMRKLIASQTYDYLFSGHTHVADDRLHGRTRAINPGALYRASRKSVALLDTSDGTLETIVVSVRS